MQEFVVDGRTIFSVGDIVRVADYDAHPAFAVAVGRVHDMTENDVVIQDLSGDGVYLHTPNARLTEAIEDGEVTIEVLIPALDVTDERIADLLD